jgi:geranylgeranyl diphosphate synthase type II
VLTRLELDGSLSASGRAVLEDAVWGGQATSKSMADVQWLFALLERQGSVDYAAHVARDYACAASTTLDQLTWLPRSPHRAIIEGLVEYVHARTR